MLHKGFIRYVLIPLGMAAALVAARPAPVVFVGSSMGGYWAGRPCFYS